MIVKEWYREMNTGLFELMQSIKEPEIIVRYLNKSPYDELIEIDLNTYRFKSIHHVSQKYATPLTEGTYKEMFIGMSEILVHPNDRERFMEMMHPETLPFKMNSSAVKGMYCDEFRFKLVNGNWRWVEVTLLSGKEYAIPAGICRMYITDCHARKVRETGDADKYNDIVNNRSELTGLLRKQSFITEAESLLSTTEINWCVVSIDIENFKLFNEWYGHDEGDLLMVQIGAVLLEACDRLGGTAGYFGQDDFCLMIPHDMLQIEHLYEEVASLVTSRGGGIGFMPALGFTDVDRKKPFLDMLDRAFLAAKVAKESYHNRIRAFDKKMYQRADLEYRVLTDILKALKCNEIVFYLQPQCRASSGKIVGAEALARWIKPDGTLIPPDEFIPILEKHGLITDLDLYIWREVCKWQRSWIDKGHTPLPVSVNVSVDDILHTDLPTVFEELIEQYDLDRKLIKIEITETSYISNASSVMNTVRSLREKGFTVMMDDFGSGYSTLNMLKNLSIDAIKLDAQFLSMDESNTEKSIRILESVTNMTKIIGVPIIVEGVENEEQKDFLRDMGCRYIQGYFYYRPIPIDEYEKIIVDEDKIDDSGITFKASQQFRLRELLDDNVYSDTMLNNILGPCAFYSLHGDDVDIIRYNEQFYEAADIPNFAERLSSIQQYMPVPDRPRIVELLNAAHNDRLNGAKGVMHFYKPDGTLTTFYMHFYYLRKDGDCRIFYGAVQNITKLSTLEKQMSLLARFSNDTVLYLTRTPDNEIQFSVLSNGLEKDIGLDTKRLESALNSDDFYSLIGTENHRLIYLDLMKKIRNSESFYTEMNVKNTEGIPLTLYVQGDYMEDDTDSINYIITVKKTVS